ncbi:MAG: hypothetical protein ABIJ82_00030 [Patescibacteria group bacterium]|nr:hypothetical protein [Patescibacteria group bacterium]MBU1952898.1 hypothetical protein [Patescibacteria group bacterium]
MGRLEIGSRWKFEIVAFLITGLLLYKVDFSIDTDSYFYFKKHDIYYDYQAAKQLQHGENPYNRILEGNMIENDKYATQLPLYFYFLALIGKISQNNFDVFLENFRLVLFWFHLAGGVFMYLLFRRINKLFVGYCAAVFYMFNVWSLNSFMYLKQDMIAIALLVLSFYFFRNKTYRWISYVLFGLSLGIKHIGIFAFPIYLTPILFKEDSFKRFGLNMLLLFSTILIPAAPLLIDNSLSFVNSMLFSLTRSPRSSEIIYGYNELLVKYNPSFNKGTLFQQLLPRLPLFIASILCLLMLLLRKIPLSVYLFISILVFAIFNPVIFPQYITWVTPMALISLVDYTDHVQLQKRV